MLHLHLQGEVREDLGQQAGIQGGGPDVGRTVPPSRTWSQARVQGQDSDGEGSVEHPG